MPPFGRNLTNFHPHSPARLEGRHGFYDRSMLQVAGKWTQRWVVPFPVFSRQNNNAVMEGAVG